MATICSIHKKYALTVAISVHVLNYSKLAQNQHVFVVHVNHTHEHGNVR